MADARREIGFMKSRANCFVVLRTSRDIRNRMAVYRQKMLTNECNVLSVVQAEWNVWNRFQIGRSFLERTKCTRSYCRFVGKQQNVAKNCFYRLAIVWAEIKCMRLYRNPQKWSKSFSTMRVWKIRTTIVGHFMQISNVFSRFCAHKVTEKSISI